MNPSFIFLAAFFRQIFFLFVSYLNSGSQTTCGGSFWNTVQVNPSSFRPINCRLWRLLEADEVFVVIVNVVRGWLWTWFWWFASLFWIHRLWFWFRFSWLQRNKVRIFQEDSSNSFVSSFLFFLELGKNVERTWSQSLTWNLMISAIVGMVTGRLRVSFQVGLYSFLTTSVLISGLLANLTAT